MDCSPPWLPCPSPTPAACSDACPSSWWCYPTISPCHPLLHLPSIFPTIRVFPSESVLHIMWAKYWSFSFSISPSNEYSGLISFRIDRFDLLSVIYMVNYYLSHTVVDLLILFMMVPGEFFLLNYGWYTMLCQSLLHSRVTHVYLMHIQAFFFYILLLVVHPRRLDMVPCTIQ